MKARQLAWLALGVAAVVLAYAGSPKAAPAPAGPVEKWEYAEIIYSPAAARARWGADDPPFGGGGRGGRGARGGRGGLPGGAGGPGAPGAPAWRAAPPALPAQQVPPPMRRAMVRWITAAGEVEATSWEELAEKLKLPPAKSGVITPAAHRLRVLNHLGGQGWEMVNGGSASSCVFKRRVAK